MPRGAMTPDRMYACRWPTSVDLPKVFSQAGSAMSYSSAVTGAYRSMGRRSSSPSA